MGRGNGAGVGVNRSECTQVRILIIMQKLRIRMAMKHVAEQAGRLSLQDLFDRVKNRGVQIQRLRIGDRDNDPAVMRSIAKIQEANDALKKEVASLEHATDKARQVKEVIAKGNAALDRVDSLIEFVA